MSKMAFSMENEEHLVLYTYLLSDELDEQKAEKPTGYFISVRVCPDCRCHNNHSTTFLLNITIEDDAVSSASFTGIDRHSAPSWS